MATFFLINPPAPEGGWFIREGRCTQESGFWGTQWPPLTLAYLAAVLEEDGHAPALFDCPAALIPVRALLRAATQRRPAWCILATSTPTFADDMDLAARLREAAPGTRVALLGVHATALDREILEAFPQVDAVLRREPEETVRALARAGDEPDALSGIAGLSLRAQGRTVREADRPFIKDLDALPFPAWKHVHTRDYRLPFSGRPFLSIAPLRGCHHRCTFCTAGAYYGSRLRLRGVESVVQEILRDRRDFGVTDFFFWAETFTLDRDFVLRLCAALRRGSPGVRWTCNSRLDTVDEAMLREMAAAGCWMVSFGIESTDPGVLAGVGKRLDARRPLAVTRLARRLGIATVGHFILGLPGDDPERIARTVRDALAADLDFAQFYAAAPFVGSALFEQARARGWLAEEDLPRVSQSRATLRLPGLSPAAVNRLRRRAILRFYLRPRQIARVLAVAGWGVLRPIGVALRRWCRERVLRREGQPPYVTR